jgi:hypothetical protein
MKPNKEHLISKALEQIVRDVSNQDLTAIEELLKFIPDEYLIGFLTEEGIDQ